MSIDTKDKEQEEATTSKVLSDSERANAIDVAKRLYAKVKGGETQAERDTAKRVLDRYMAKRGLKMEDIIEVKCPARHFKITHPDDEFILTNVVLSVNPFAVTKFGKKMARVELDEEDFKEVTHKYEYFLNLWNADREMLTMAFFSLHASYFAPDEYTMNKLRHKMGKSNAYTKAQQQAEDLQERANKGASSWKGMSAEEKMKLFNMRRKDAIIDKLMKSNYRPTR